MNNNTGGMSKREFYAAAAMLGLCANSDISKAAAEKNLTPSDVRLSFAVSAFKLADLMIAESKKNKHG